MSPRSVEYKRPFYSLEAYDIYQIKVFVKVLTPGDSRRESKFSAGGQGASHVSRYACASLGLAHLVSFLLLLVL